MDGFSSILLPTVHNLDNAVNHFLDSVRQLSAHLPSLAQTGAEESS